MCARPARRSDNSIDPSMQYRLQLRHQQLHLHEWLRIELRISSVHSQLEAGQHLGILAGTTRHRWLWKQAKQIVNNPTIPRPVPPLSTMASNRLGAQRTHSAWCALHSCLCRVDSRTLSRVPQNVHSQYRLSTKSVHTLPLELNDRQQSFLWTQNAPMQHSRKLEPSYVTV